MKRLVSFFIALSIMVLVACGGGGGGKGSARSPQDRAHRFDIILQDAAGRGSINKSIELDLKEGDVLSIDELNVLIAPEERFTILSRHLGTNQTLPDAVAAALAAQAAGGMEGNGITTNGIGERSVKTRIERSFANADERIPTGIAGPAAPPPPPPLVETRAETGSDAGADDEGARETGSLSAGGGRSTLRTNLDGAGSDDDADDGEAEEAYFLSDGAADGGRSTLRTNLGGTDDDADEGARETYFLSAGAAGGGKSNIRTNLGGSGSDDGDEREAYFLSDSAAGGGRSNIRTNLGGTRADDEGGEARKTASLSDGADGSGTDPDQGVLRGDGGNGTRVFKITVGAETVDLTVEEMAGSYEYGIIIYALEECDSQGENCFTPSNLSGLEDFTVHLKTEDGTAVGGNGSAGDDYESLNTSVTFSPSDFGCVVCGARKLVTGEIYADDLFEREETFVIRLRGAADNSPFIRVAPAESIVHHSRQ